jgi:hypothetical protein
MKWFVRESSHGWTVRSPTRPAFLYPRHDRPRRLRSLLRRQITISFRRKWVISNHASRVKNLSFDFFLLFAHPYI